MPLCSRVPLSARPARPVQPRVGDAFFSQVDAAPLDTPEKRLAMVHRYFEVKHILLPTTSIVTHKTFALTSSAPSDPLLDTLSYPV